MICYERKSVSFRGLSQLGSCFSETHLLADVILHSLDLIQSLSPASLDPSLLPSQRIELRPQGHLALVVRSLARHGIDAIPNVVLQCNTMLDLDLGAPLQLLRRRKTSFEARPRSCSPTWPEEHQSEREERPVRHRRPPYSACCQLARHPGKAPRSARARDLGARHLNTHRLLLDNGDRRIVSLRVGGDTWLTSLSFLGEQLLACERDLSSANNHFCTFCCSIASVSYPTVFVRPV